MCYTSSPTQQAIDAWVVASGSNFALSSGTSPGNSVNSALFGTGISSNTFSNGQTVAFSLTCLSNQNLNVITGSTIPGSPVTTYLIISNSPR
jgi:hypothetical protein